MTTTTGNKPQIELANASDAPAIKAMVASAYSKYIERLGKWPAPMSENYDALLESQNLYVSRLDGCVIGAIHLLQMNDSLSIINLVFAPAAQGRGYGRLLMIFAEDMARTHRLPALTLYTNEKMHENIALYTKAGFSEVARATEDGFKRVYFRKTVSVWLCHLSGRSNWLFA